MPAFSEAAYLRERVHSDCAGLRSRLKEYVSEFPAGSPLDLIKVVELFLQELEVGLGSVADVHQLKQHFYVVETLAGILTLLDNAHTAQTPRGLVLLLEKTSSLLFPNAKLLVAPWAETNYSIADIVPSFKQLASGPLSPAAQQRLEQHLPGALYVIQFPRIARENVLNHAVFGHEFGHPIADEFIAKHEKETAYGTRLQSALKKVQAHPIVDAALQKLSSPLEKGKYLSGISEHVSTIHRRGLQELLSDAIAVEIFGPSAGFAFMDLLLQGPLDSAPRAPQFYPPSRYRLRWILSRLSDNGHIKALRALQLKPELAEVSDTLQKTLDYLETATADQTDLANLKNDPLVDAAYEWLEQTLADALPDAKDRTKAFPYPPDKIEQEVPGLLERMRLLVPPNELGRGADVSVVDWRSSLVSSWLYILNETLQPATDQKEKQKKLLTIQNLALKGAELALLQADYNSYLIQHGLNA